MSARTYTFTVRRSRLFLAAGAAAVLVATLVLFGQLAWLVNAGLVFTAAWLIHRIQRPAAVHTARTNHNSASETPGSDAQLIADAIQTASLRDMVLRDMRGGI